MDETKSENTGNINISPIIITPEDPTGMEDNTTTDGKSNAESTMDHDLIAEFEHSSTATVDNKVTAIRAENIGDGNDIVVMGFEQEQTGDGASVVGADLEIIKNEMDEKKLLDQEQSIQLETFDEGDSASQLSSMPSTPASFSETVGNHSTSRRGRGRRKRMGPPDVNLSKKFIFGRSVAKRIGKQSLRRKMERENGNDDGDRFGDGGHCFIAQPTAEDGGIVVDEKNTSVRVDGQAVGDYCRALFVSQYDDPLPQVPIDESANTCDVDVDDSALIKEVTAPVDIATVVLPEENETDMGLVKYLQKGLSLFMVMYDDAQNVAVSVSDVLEQEEDEETDTTWPERLIRDATTLAQRKLTERITKLLNDVNCSNLVASGNSDEWILRMNSINHGTSLLRQCFAAGVAAAGYSLLSWIHWQLMKILPADICAWYLLILRELYSKTPDIVISAVHSDPDIDQRAKILLAGFLLEPKRVNLQSELFFSQQPPPQLPRDPILMLVSSNIKAHSDMLAHGNARSQYFYRYLLPHLGFCMDVKFSPFRKGMSVGMAAEQLCAFLRDKIREVQYFHADRPIVLIGWQTVGLVALKVALEKSVAAVVCLGFPNVSLYGPRGITGDELFDVTCPTLFVVGQFAPTYSTEDLANLRKNMKSERTGVVVVGGSDDDLKMSATKLRSENLCQEIVDRCILESIGEFLCPVLETYVATPVEPPVAANNSGVIAMPKPEAVSTEALPSKRRRNTIGLSPILDIRKLGKIRVASGSKASFRASVDYPVEEKLTGSSRAAASEAPQLVLVKPTPEATSTKRTEDMTPSTEENLTPSLGATRTRQIRKPNMLDL